MTKLFLGIFVLISLCAFTESFDESRDWDFIQSVGGIKIGTVAQNGEEWSVPIHADVSGLKEITIKPKMMNSALICSDVVYAREAEKIFVQIKTALTGTGQGSSECPDLKLKGMEVGHYQVFYGEKGNENHLIGNVEIVK